jgi:spermidine synthase
VIGIVLAGIAAGNYVGGRLADRYRPWEALASLFLLASAACLLVPLLNDRVGAWQFLRDQEWSVRIACHVFAVFFFPSTMMGTISPVAAKMALELGRETGRTVGSVYSWGAIGSIFGTFLTGYVLIAKLGTVSVLLTVAAILAAMGLFFGSRWFLPFLWGGVVAASLLVMLGPWDWARTIGERLRFRPVTGDEIHFQEESQYSFIRVQDELDSAGLRSMTLDFLIHAYVVMDDPDDLRYEYEQVYSGVTRQAMRTWPAGRQPRALCLGGGGFVFPRWLVRHWPRSHVEVAELDPAVTRAAFTSFGLPRDTSMKIHNLDARNHVDDLLDRRRQGRTVGDFDFIYADAFNHYSPPFHLTTLEFHHKLRRLMAPDGVYMANIIDIYNPGLFLGAIINTVERVFPHVYVVSTAVAGPSDADDSRDTFVVIGSLRALALDRANWERRIGFVLSPAQLATLRKRSRALVLTDDYAPVDNLLTPVIRGVER